MCAAICKRGFKRSEDGQTCIGTGTFPFYHMMLALACADPESFARGGPTLTTFFLVDEIKAGHHQPASETPSKWRFPGMSMMAQH